MALEVVKLSCNHCGANLKVTSDTRFVTCTYCDTQLEVRRKDGAAFTRVKRSVEKLRRRAKKLARDVRRLERENELERLDRDWEREREGLLIHTKNGRTIVPSMGLANLLVGASVVIGAISLLLMFSDGLENFALVGLALTLFTAIGGIIHRSSAEKYERAEQDYYAARALLEKRRD